MQFVENFMEITVHTEAVQNYDQKHMSNYKHQDTI